MFQAILRRAQHAVESSIDQVVHRAIMMVPFLIAGGYAAAALTYKLTADYGPEIGNLMMAGVFCALGIVTALFLSSRAPAAQAAAEESAAATVASNEQEASAQAIDDADKEVLTAAVTALAPVAGPHVIQMLLRNLPLLAVIAAAVLFFISRTPDETASPAESQPATS